MSLKPYGQIGAGRVVPFSQPSKKKHLVAVPETVAKLEPLLFYVCGDSFIDEGISDGAMMIARRDFCISEVVQGRLCIVRIAESDEMMKRVFLIPGGRVLLRCGNFRYEDIIKEAEFVEIVALVEGEYIARK